MIRTDSTNLFAALIELCKIRITVAVAITTVAGYALGKGSIDPGVIPATFGLFLVACGSAALNHWQEWRSDARMQRTSARPIPSGRVAPMQAFGFALFLVLCGSLLLYVVSGLIAALLSLLALIWYNGFYTPLKKVSAYAVIPGGLIGSIPPLVGWVAAGRNPLELEILAFAFFIFMWQVPHFWLLAMFLGRDYDQGGFPCISNQFSEDQMKRIIFSWTAATAISSFLIPLTHPEPGPWLTLWLAFLTTWILAKHSGLIRGLDLSYKAAFMQINFYALMVMVTLVIHRLVA